MLPDLIGEHIILRAGDVVFRGQYLGNEPGVVLMNVAGDILRIRIPSIRTVVPTQELARR